MNRRSRRLALYAIGLIALLASVDALVHSYAGLYSWAAHHRLRGWQAWSWPAEIDVFLVVGELALYVAYLDAWPARQRLWPWITAVAGLVVSVAGNVGHVQSSPDGPATIADRVTAATSPVAAFAGLMIGLLVLKVSRDREESPKNDDGRVLHVTSAPAGEQTPGVVRDAVRILDAAQAQGMAVSQRALAVQLRELGHRFSNAELREIARAAHRSDAQQAA